MFESLTDAISGSAISYLVVLLAAGGDVVFPPIPSETIVITAGIVAGQGKLSLPLLILVAAVGAMIGDNVAYWLGRRIGDPVARRLFRGEKAAANRRWAERAIRRHGAVLIVAGRFIPGGRTAATFVAGTAELPWRRFLAIDACAALLWSAYANLLGYLGGATFKNHTWKAFAVSLGLATLVALGVEVWRRVQKRRGRDVLGDPLSDGGG